jgi:shikimate kinase
MKIILFLELIISVLTANAQNYLIGFAGTGSSTIGNTVNVENLFIKVED